MPIRVALTVLCVAVAGTTMLTNVVRTLITTTTLTIATTILASASLLSP